MLWRARIYCHLRIPKIPDGQVINYLVRHFPEVVEGTAYGDVRFWPQHTDPEQLHVEVYRLLDFEFETRASCETYEAEKEIWKELETRHPKLMAYANFNSFTAIPLEREDQEKWLGEKVEGNPEDILIG